MAVTRRGYIFGAFVTCLLSVLLVLVSVSSDNWVVSTATADIQVQDSTINYGLFTGELVLQNFETPTSNTLYMTCVPSVGACALSCKTDADARLVEVEALAQGYRPTLACVAVVEVDTTNPMANPPVISFAIYVSLLVILFLQLMMAVIAAGLAIINATKNPTEPVFGLPGCLWSNVVTTVLGLAVLLLFGIYWATSGLQEHLALTHIAVGQFTPNPGLGFSYWVLIAAIFCNICSVCLITLRGYLLERDPPPPTLKVENHSDGTIFLY